MNTQTNTLKTMTAQPQHHYARTFFAAVCGTLALVLILLSILTVWLNQTLTNTAVFVQTLTPLAAQPDVQQFVAQKVADNILQGAPVQDIAGTLLPANDINGKTAAQLQEAVRLAIIQNILQIEQAPQFASLWHDSLQSVHSQLVSQLNANTGTVTLDLRPVIQGVLAQLRTTSLAPVADHVQLDNNAGVVDLQGSNIEKIRGYYHLFQVSTVLLVAVALVFAVLCVLLSVHHLKTLRRMLVGVGVVALLIAAGLQTSTFISIPSDPFQQKATAAIIGTLFHNLQLAALILGIACILGAIASKLISVVRARR